MTEYRPHRRCLALWTLLGALLATPAVARESGEPQRFHVVYPGQRLITIAKRYKVSVEAICTANGLRRGARLKPGEKLTIPGLDDPDGSKARSLYPPVHPSDVATTVPASTRDEKEERRARDGDPEGGPRIHKVCAGQRLESIAKRYKVSVAALCAENGITRRVKLHAGDTLRIPSPGDAPDLGLEGDPLHDEHAPHRLPRLGLRKSYLDLFTYSGHFRGYALDKKGRIEPLAETEVSKLLGAGGSRPATDPKLIRLLAKVSDHFGNRPIRIVSGYRTRSFFEDSKHKSSRAVDFSIPGVDNVRVRDYLRTLSEVGVGYYPNSSFVHLDVRDTTTYWVDFAGPGERPRDTKTRDHEAEGDLHDPEVAEGDHPNEREAPTLEAPAPEEAETPAASSEAPAPAPAPNDMGFGLPASSPLQNDPK
jgi:LysM repeat protein